MKKNIKQRWKNLSTRDRLARKCKQSGKVSEDTIDMIRNGDKTLRKMIYTAANGREIIFDAWEDSTEEFGTYWADICPDCCKKYKKELWGKIADGASGEASCYICGCENTNAEAYVDFDKNEVRFE